MSKNLNGLKFSKEHEWVRIDGNKAYIGITDFAQHSLGEIVFVELPELDAELSEGDTLGVVESVKAASDIYSPISGKVLEINENLMDNPGNVNKEPYESWIAALQIDNEAQLDILMSVEEYEKFCAEEES